MIFDSLSVVAPKWPQIALKCRIDGNHIDEIKWLKNQKPLGLNDSLIIRHPNQNDNGYYTCIARNKFGTIKSHPYRIEIHAGAYNSYHNMAMFCEPKINDVYRNEKYLVCWYKYSGGGGDNRGRRLHRKRSATETGSQSSKRKKLTIAEDNLATINCDVSGLDRKAYQMSVRWKKDGKITRQSMLNEANNDMSNLNPMENPMFRDDGRITMDTKNGSIKIASTIPSDAGVYEVSTLPLFSISFVI